MNVGNPNALPSELAAVVGTIDPDNYSANTYTSNWVDMNDWEAGMAILLLGDLGTGATVDAKLEQATNGSGGGAKDISGKAITQLTQAGSDGDKQAIINFRRDDLDIANNFTHVRLSATNGTEAMDACGVVLGFFPRYNVASDNDLASVDEIVS